MQLILNRYHTFLINNGLKSSEKILIMQFIENLGLKISQRPSLINLFKKNVDKFLKNEDDQNTKFRMVLSQSK